LVLNEPALHPAPHGAGCLAQSLEGNQVNRCAEKTNVLWVDVEVEARQVRHDVLSHFAPTAGGREPTATAGPSRAAEAAGAGPGPARTAQVQLQPGQQANVNVEKAQQPQVHFEQTGQPKVQYNVTGQPKINYEQAQPGDTQHRADANQQVVRQDTTTGATQPATAAQGQRQPMSASQINKMKLYNERGDQMNFVVLLLALTS
jgi:hypothetical protein